MSPEDRDGFIGKDAVGTATVRDELSILRQFLEP